MLYLANPVKKTANHSAISVEDHRITILAMLRTSTQVLFVSKYMGVRLTATRVRYVNECAVTMTRRIHHTHIDRGRERVLTLTPHLSKIT